MDPKIKLAVDLHRMDNFFRIGSKIQKGFDMEMIIDRTRYDEVAAMLEDYGIIREPVIHEFCFIILWIEKEISPDRCERHQDGNFYLMWNELEALKQYLLQNRVTSVTFRGEYGRNKPGEELTLKDGINIDRICDGLRSVFREEFNHDVKNRRTKGLTAWQRRKLGKIRNNLMGYFASIPALDELSLEAQGELIDQLNQIAGAG